METLMALTLLVNFFCPAGFPYFTLIYDLFRLVSATKVCYFDPLECHDSVKSASHFVNKKVKKWPIWWLCLTRFLIAILPQTAILPWNRYLGAFCQNHIGGGKFWKDPALGGAGRGPACAAASDRRHGTDTCGKCAKFWKSFGLATPMTLIVFEDVVSTYEPFPRGASPQCSRAPLTLLLLCHFEALPSSRPALWVMVALAARTDSGGTGTSSSVYQVTPE
jgi:hypothetical protein